MKGMSSRHGKDKTNAFKIFVGNISRVNVTSSIQSVAGLRKEMCPEQN
jgi:hypothetical protein